MNKRDTRNFERFLRVHLTTGPRTLYGCYKEPSGFKELAYNLCLERCEKYEGKGFTIVGATLFHFSVGFVVRQGDKAIFFFITAYNEFVSKLNEEQIEQCRKVGIKI